MEKKMKKITASSVFFCILFSFAVATAWNPSENKDFFVDPETGEPNAIVVVGAYAAASDVTAGAWVAAQIGSMIYYKEEVTEKVVYEYFSGENYEDRDPDAILVGNTEGDFKNGPYAELESLWYDDKNNNKVLDLDESREEVFVDFTSAYSYPIIDLYNFQYKTIIKGEPETEIWKGDEDYLLYTNPITVKFLGHFYDMIGSGSYKSTGQDYAIYGTPKIEEYTFKAPETPQKGKSSTTDMKYFYGWWISPHNVSLFQNTCEWYISGPNDEESTKYKINLEKGPVAIAMKERVGKEKIVTFCFKTIKISGFVGSEGTSDITIKTEIYALTDTGVINDTESIKPCGPEGYQWDLDIDVGEDITIAMKLNSVLDVRITGGEITLPLCEWEFPKEGIRDHDTNTGDVPIYLELPIDDSNDYNHTDLVISKGFTVTQQVITGTATEKTEVEIDPMSIVVNDDEVTETMKASSNLVLVGGPGLTVDPFSEELRICNTLTKELCDQKLSTIDWFNSDGEYEYIADAFVEGKDVIIVAGKDRESTRHAVENLLNDLKA